MVFKKIMMGTLSSTLIGLKVLEGAKKRRNILQNKRAIINAFKSMQTILTRLIFHLFEGMFIHMGYPIRKIRNR